MELRRLYEEKCAELERAKQEKVAGYEEEAELAVEDERLQAEVGRLRAEKERNLGEERNCKGQLEQQASIGKELEARLQEVVEDSKYLTKDVNDLKAQIDSTQREYKLKADEIKTV